MEGEERDGVMGSFKVGILVRKAGFTAKRSGDAPASAAAAREKDAPLTPSVSVSQCLIIAGSRLRVWRSLRLVMALDAGEEQEKTLLRSPWAADMSPYFGSHISAAQCVSKAPHTTVRPEPIASPLAVRSRFKLVKSWNVLHLAADAARSGQRASFLFLSCDPLHVGHSHTEVEWEDRVCARVWGRGYRKLEISAYILYFFQCHILYY